MSALHEYLSKVKVGDRVIVERREYAEIRRVERETPKQLVLSNGIHYHKNTGRAVGTAGSWDSNYISMWSEQRHAEVIAANRDRRFKRDLNAIPWFDDNITPEQRSAAHEFLTELGVINNE